MRVPCSSIKINIKIKVILYNNAAWPSQSSDLIWRRHCMSSGVSGHICQENWTTIGQAIWQRENRYVRDGGLWRANISGSKSYSDNTNKKCCRFFFFFNYHILNMKYILIWYFKIFFILITNDNEFLKYPNVKKCCADPTMTWSYVILQLFLKTSWTG